MLEWILEGSTDGQNWTQIACQSTDEFRNTGESNPVAKKVSFEISNPIECRFIHLVQPMQRSLDGDMFHLFCVEFFGTLEE
jgi:hypothetical protein